MVLPSGDQTGWRASLKRSVTRRASPPVAGITQMLPCRSIASVLPSGETETDMEVPSSTVTVTSFGATGPGAALAVTANSTRTSDNSLRVMNVPLLTGGRPYAAAMGHAERPLLMGRSG